MSCLFYIRGDRIRTAAADRLRPSGPKPDISLKYSKNVGETGFEPATLWSQTRCATGLRHSPKNIYFYTLPVLSGRQDSNGPGWRSSDEPLRPSGSRPDALPGYAIPHNGIAEKDFTSSLLSKKTIMRRERDSNPRYPLEVRQFSKLLVSATHPSLRLLSHKDRRIGLILTNIPTKKLCQKAGLSNFGYRNTCVTPLR